MTNISAVIKDELVGAFNDHDIDRVLQCFDDNAVVNLSVAPPGFPNTLRGKSEIQKFFQQVIPGGHVEVSNVKTQGDRVDWTVRLTSDLFRNVGLKQVEANDWATVKNNKIVSFNPNFPPHVVQAFQQQTMQTGTRPGRH